MTPWLKICKSRERNGMANTNGNAHYIVSYKDCIFGATSLPKKNMYVFLYVCMYA